MVFSIVGFLSAYHYDECDTKIYNYYTLAQVVVSSFVLCAGVMAMEDLAAAACDGTNDMAQCDANFRTSFYISSPLCAFLSPRFLSPRSLLH